jgi:hypothetical protein
MNLYFISVEHITVEHITGKTCTRYFVTYTYISILQYRYGYYMFILILTATWGYCTGYTVPSTGIWDLGYGTVPVREPVENQLFVGQERVERVARRTPKTPQTDWKCCGILRIF